MFLMHFHANRHEANLPQANRKPITTFVLAPRVTYLVYLHRDVRTVPVICGYPSCDNRERIYCHVMLNRTFCNANYSRLLWMSFCFRESSVCLIFSSTVPGVLAFVLFFILFFVLVVFANSIQQNSLRFRKVLKDFH